MRRLRIGCLVALASIAVLFLILYGYTSNGALPESTVLLLSKALSNAVGGKFRYHCYNDYPTLAYSYRSVSPQLPLIPDSERHQGLAFNYLPTLTNIRFSKSVVDESTNTLFVYGPDVIQEHFARSGFAMISKAKDLIVYQSAAPNGGPDHLEYEVRWTRDGRIRALVFDDEARLLKTTSKDLSPVDFNYFLDQQFVSEFLTLEGHYEEFCAAEDPRVLRILLVKDGVAKMVTHHGYPSYQLPKPFVDFVRALKRVVGEDEEDLGIKFISEPPSWSIALE